MSEVQYRYCVDKTGKLVCIDGILEDSRNTSQFFCLDCGSEMVPKIGNIREHHFAHKAITGCTGDGETYLHRFAKKRIKEAILNNELTSFWFESNGVCSVSNCDINGKTPCFKKYWFQGKLNNVTSIKEEERVGEYIADLALYFPDRNTNFLIEVRVTHECSDQKKASGLFIIETNIIENEKDVEHIVNKGCFVDGKNCKMYGLPEYLPAPVLGLKNINRFIITRDGNMSVFNIFCSQQDKRITDESIVELNIASGDNQEDIMFEGLCYLLDKGLTIPKLNYNQMSFKERYDTEFRNSIFSPGYGVREVYIDKSFVASNPFNRNWKWK